MFTNPHLDENGYDVILGQKHCMECGDQLTDRQSVVKSFTRGTWEHYTFVDVPEVIATHPVTGHTIEGEIAIPSRRIQAVYPKMTSLSFCIGCFPLELNPEGLCPCGHRVHTDHSNYTTVSLIDLHPPGYGKNLRTVRVHIGCLSEHFQHVKDSTEDRLAKS